MGNHCAHCRGNLYVDTFDDNTVKGVACGRSRDVIVPLPLVGNDRLKTRSNPESRYDELGNRKTPLPGYCRRGHRMTRDNMIIQLEGHVTCRECMRQTRRKWAARKREEATA